MITKNELKFLPWRWVAYWIDLVCSVIGILTLGFYRPWWDLDFRVFQLKTTQRVLKYKGDKNGKLK